MKPSNIWRVGLISASIIILIFCTFIVALANTNKQLAPLKVGFICVGETSDHGWNYSHDKGRLEMEKLLPGKVQTTIAEKVAENAEAERVMEKMIAQGNKLIFSTSYGYLDQALKVANRHPNVVFMQVDRFQTTKNKNLGTYFAHQYQPMYLAGMVAGRMTKSNRLGFIAAHPVPTVLQTINAFTLGARSVNPKATIQVIWINSWSEPALEAEAAKGLVESGCDVITNTQDHQNVVVSVCERLHVYYCGFYTDSHDLAPKEWLTGSCLEWAPLFARIATSVQNKTWKPEMITAGMEGGYIQLSSFGKAVPKSYQQEVLSKEADIKSGKFHVFQGPLKDRKGRIQLPAGQIADIKYLANMDWFVDGVEGTLPKE